MKKLASAAVSGLLLLSTLTACGTTTAIDTMAVDTTVQAQSAKTITLSMDKKETSTTKKVETDKDVKVKVTAKKSADEAKKGDAVNVKFQAPSGKNDLDSQNYAMIARYSLQSMNQASSYEQGYKIGMEALMSMARQNVYVAKVSWSAANATKSWNSGYKMVAAALNHLSAERPNTPYEICQLVMRMMGSADSYEDGYKAGFAAMQVIGQTDNQSVRMIIDLALRQANSTSNWNDGYNVIRNAYISLSSNFRGE